MHSIVAAAVPRIIITDDDNEKDYKLEPEETEDDELLDRRNRILQRRQIAQLNSLRFD